MGVTVSGRLHHLHHYAILRWQIFYLHDQLGLWSDHDHHAARRRACHTLALRSAECAESGTGSGPEGQHNVRPEDLLVAAQYVTANGTGHLHSILDISKWTHE